MTVPYRPTLLNRLNARLRPSSPRITSVVMYDYMGSAEFEFGSIPDSLAEIRSHIAQTLDDPALLGDGMEILAGPDNLVATTGPHEGERLHVLAMKGSNQGFNKYGESLWSGLRDLIDGKARCKEWTAIEAYFRKPYGNGLWYDAWHDIQNHLFIAFNPRLLEIIRALLADDIDIKTPSEIAKYFRIGDDVTGIEPKKDKFVSGKVAGISDDFVTIKNHGKRYRLPWCCVTSRPADMPLPRDPKAVARR